jgi:threonine aldolase
LKTRAETKDAPTRPDRSFRSDNNAGVCPEAMAAILETNRKGHALGYGGDELTEQAVHAFRALFGPDTGVFFVATGTIANTLALACLVRPWSRILCHHESHLNDDESTAPELFTRCRVTTISTPEDRSKLTVDDIERAAVTSRGDVHQPQPGALTISNPTEFGEVYTPDETRSICEVAHTLGYRVHVDGARFANAVASLGCHPKELTIDAGVDALSFGGTKNGLAFGEAALFFPQGDAAAHARAVHEFPYLRKAAGALLSKHRFVSAPFLATLRDDAWLRHAGHANAMARRLARGLTGAGLQIPYAVDANAVFPILGGRLDNALHERGHAFYRFGAPERGMARLMCSFDTEDEEIDAFIADVRELASA